MPAASATSTLSPLSQQRPHYKFTFIKPISTCDRFYCHHKVIELHCACNWERDLLFLTRRQTRRKYPILGEERENSNAAIGKGEGLNLVSLKINTPHPEREGLKTSCKDAN